MSSENRRCPGLTVWVTCDFATHKRLLRNDAATGEGAGKFFRGLDNLVHAIVPRRGSTKGVCPNVFANDVHPAGGKYERLVLNHLDQTTRMVVMSIGAEGCPEACLSTLHLQYMQKWRFFEPILGPFTCKSPAVLVILLGILFPRFLCVSMQRCAASSDK